MMARCCIVAKDDRAHAHRSRLWPRRRAARMRTSSRIIDETIAPQFKQGDFYGGINAGLDQIITRDRRRAAAAARSRAGSPTNDLGKSRRHSCSLRCSTASLRCSSGSCHLVPIAPWAPIAATVRAAASALAASAASIPSPPRALRCCRDAGGGGPQADVAAAAVGRRWRIGGGGGGGGFGGGGGGIQRWRRRQLRGRRRLGRAGRRRAPRRSFVTCSPRALAHARAHFSDGAAVHRDRPSAAAEARCSGEIRFVVETALDCPRLERPHAARSARCRSSARPAHLGHRARQRRTHLCIAGGPRRRDRRGPRRRADDRPGRLEGGLPADGRPLPRRTLRARVPSAGVHGRRRDCSRGISRRDRGAQSDELPNQPCCCSTYPVQLDHVPRDVILRP